MVIRNEGVVGSRPAIGTMYPIDLGGYYAERRSSLVARRSSLGSKSSRGRHGVATADGAKAGFKPNLRLQAV